MKRTINYFAERSPAGVRYRLSPPTRQVAISTPTLKAFFERFHERPGYNVIAFTQAKREVR